MVPANIDIALLISALTLLAPSGIEAAEDRAQPDLIYTIEARLDDERLGLRVDVTIPGNVSGRTTLVLPSEWGGRDSLFKGVANLRVEGGEIADAPSPELRVVTHDPGSTLRVQYDIVQYWSGSMRGPGGAYRPILHPEYFHLIGHAALLVPEGDAAIPRDIRLAWTEFPEDWNLCNSFGANQRTQVLRISLDELRHAVYLGGDFRLRQTEIEGNEIAVAMRGAWPFKDDEFFGLVEMVIRTQRDFWKDHTIPYYLVTLIPTGTECCSYSGTSITNSFATFVSTDRGIDFDLKHLLAHELLHHWIGQTIRSVDTPEQPEGTHYWFSEGFTDYYTRRCLHEAGLITTQEMLENLNRRLYNYFTSPERNSSNLRIVQAYWTDRYVQKLPYQRGDLLAGRWDAEIRAVSEGVRSLDDVILALLEDARDPEFRLSVATLKPHLEETLGRTVDEDLRRFIDDGETIEPDPHMLGAGFSLERVQMRAFDLGFDLETSAEAGEIRDVRPGGPAALAGLRDGQSIVGWSVHFDDPGREVSVTVDDGSREREIRYLPAGEPVHVPQIRRDP